MNTTPMRILIVDDEAAVCASLAEPLAEEGFTVESCLNASAGREAWTARHFGVVLYDYNLAGLNGVAATREIRALQP